MSSLNEQGTYRVAVYPISRHTEDKLHTIASILSGISTLERVVSMLTSYSIWEWVGNNE